MAPPRKKRKRRPVAAPLTVVDAVDADAEAEAGSDAPRARRRTARAVTTTARASKAPAAKSLIPEGPEWRRQDLLLLSAITAGVMAVLAAVLVFTGGAGATIGTYLTYVVLLPAAPIAILFIGLSVFVAMPIVVRIAKRRRLRFFEILAYSAVIAFLCALSSSGVIALLNATGANGGAAATASALPTPVSSLPTVTATAIAEATSPPVVAATAHPATSASARPSGSPSASPSGTTTLATVPASTIGLVGLVEALSFALAAIVYPPVGRMLRNSARPKSDRDKDKKTPPKGGRSRR